MKFLSTAVLSLSLAASASARSSRWFSGSDSVSTLEDGGPVTGENPLHYCVKPTDYTLSIEHVDLYPNPPLIGHPLKITANGTLNEAVEEGTKVHIEVKYGLIKLISQDVDLCENVKEVNLTCPIEKGKMSLTKTVDIPNQAPPGKYTVLANVYKETKIITCLTATLFLRKGAAAELVEASELDL